MPEIDETLALGLLVSAIAAYLFGKSLWFVLRSSQASGMVVGFISDERKRIAPIIEYYAAGKRRNHHGDLFSKRMAHAEGQRVTIFLLRKKPSESRTIRELISAPAFVGFFGASFLFFWWLDVRIGME